MATIRGTEFSLTEMLENLIQLDYDAIGAYDTAIDKLENATLRAKMTTFRQDHERHVRELSAQLRSLGAEPPLGADLKGLLTKGKVFLANLMGDQAILIAMRTNEDDTNQAYEQAISRTDIHSYPELLRILQASLGDERRHREWIVAEIQRLEMSTGYSQPHAK